MELTIAKRFFTNQQDNIKTRVLNITVAPIVCALETIRQMTIVFGQIGSLIAKQPLSLIGKISNSHTIKNLAVKCASPSDLLQSIQNVALFALLILTISISGAIYPSLTSKKICKLAFPETNTPLLPQKLNPTPTPIIPSNTPVIGSSSTILPLVVNVQQDGKIPDQKATETTDPKKDTQTTLPKKEENLQASTDAVTTTEQMTTLKSAILLVDSQAPNQEEDVKPTTQMTEVNPMVTDTPTVKPIEIAQIVESTGNQTSASTTNKSETLLDGLDASPNSPDISLEVEIHSGQPIHESEDSKPLSPAPLTASVDSTSGQPNASVDTSQQPVTKANTAKKVKKQAPPEQGKVQALSRSFEQPVTTTGNASRRPNAREGVQPQARGRQQSLTPTAISGDVVVKEAPLSKQTPHLQTTTVTNQQPGRLSTQLLGSIASVIAPGSQPSAAKSTTINLGIHPAPASRRSSISVSTDTKLPQQPRGLSLPSDNRVANLFAARAQGQGVKPQSSDAKEAIAVGKPQEPSAQSSRRNSLEASSAVANLFAVKAGIQGAKPAISASETAVPVEKPTEPTSQPKKTQSEIVNAGKAGLANLANLFAKRSASLPQD